ncbi:hypothetical protein M758_9G165100 [Ceratodon purpureus]|nr:hypothetical protein M758_9G165100 [Ceratodon purpureus]
MLKNLVFQNRAHVFFGSASAFQSKRRSFCKTMSSTNPDPTHGIDTPMEPIETKPPVPRSVMVSRLREITGAQPMDTAWEQLWKEGITPWDAQGVTPAITTLLKQNKLREGKVLVPGCGSGYDVVAMASPTRRVTGLDISKTALEQAQLFAEKSPNAEFIEFQNADFFSFAPPSKFDLVFDYTFFCALEPSLREQWAEKMAELLALDGELITLMFPLDEHEGGPPYSVSLEAYEKVLRPHGFHLTSCDAEIPSVESRKGMEKLARWERAISKA